MKKEKIRQYSCYGPSSSLKGAVAELHPGQLTLTEVYSRQLWNWGDQSQGTSDSVNIWEWFIVCTSRSLLCGKEAGDLSGTAFNSSSILLKSTLTSCPDHLPNFSSPSINPS